MSDKDLLAIEVVKKYSLYSAGAGLVPFPMVDMAAITGLQIKMLADLGDIYDVPFETDSVRPIVAALVGGYASTKLGHGMGASMLKGVPIVGTLLGAMAVPAFASGLTWAIGRVFIQHFASGGTYLDFDPETVRAYFSSSAATTKG